MVAKSALELSILVGPTVRIAMNRWYFDAKMLKTIALMYLSVGKVSLPSFYQVPKKEEVSAGIFQFADEPNIADFDFRKGTPKH